MSNFQVFFLKLQHFGNWSYFIGWHVKVRDSTLLDSFAQIVSKSWTSSVNWLNFVVLDFHGPRTGLKEPVGDANLII